MKYQVKEFINEKYSKAVNILKDNLKEHYHIFYGLRLSEILFFLPANTALKCFFRSLKRLTV